MSNTEKKYNYIDIPDLSYFDKNRVHEVKGLNVNNSYLGVGIKNGTSYVYAIKSSPNYYSLDSQHKSDAYIYVKHNDNNSYQSYSFYRGYSYTYTEHLSVNNQKMALIAYQFVNRTADNTVTLYNIDTKLTHTALNGATETAPCHVNEKSDTSYFLRKQNESNNIEIDNNSVKIGNIKNNLGNDTYAKFNTYCAYSALDTSDYYIHDDREFNMNMNAYVWNLVDGYDIKPYSYTTLTDTTKLTAYAYIDCENSLHSFFRNNQSQIFDYDATHYKYIDFNYDNINVSGQQWKLGTNGTSSSYVYDNNINYAQFYANAKNSLKGHEFDSFENIVNHPSYRNNNETVNAYINIKGLSQPSGTESTEIMDISQNNYNTAKFIKKISGLPVHLTNENVTLSLNLTGIYDDGQYGWITQYYQQHSSISNLHATDTGVLTVDFNEISWQCNFDIAYKHDIVDSGTTISIIGFTIKDVVDTDYFKLSSQQPGVNGLLGDNSIVFNFNFNMGLFETNHINTQLDNCQITLVFNEKGGYGITYPSVAAGTNIIKINHNETPVYSLGNGGGQQASNYESKIKISDLNNTPINFIDFNATFTGSISNDNSSGGSGGNDGPEPEQGPLYYLSTNSGEIEYVYTQDLSSGDPSNADFLVSSIRTTSPAHIKYTYPNNSTSTGSATVMTLDHDSIELGGGRTLNWHVRDAQTGIPINNYGTSLYDYQLQLNKEYTMDISWNASSTSEYIRYSNKDGETTFAGPAQSISCSYIVAQQTKNANIAFTTRN